VQCRTIFSGVATNGLSGASISRREYLLGQLSRDASYRLLVSGDRRPKELGKMIALRQAQKAILEDDTDKKGRDGI
jgi:hypothetical protein